MECVFLEGHISCVFQEVIEHVYTNGGSKYLNLWF